MKPKFSNSIVRGRTNVATYGNKRAVPTPSHEKHTYHIKNVQTQHTLFSSSDYKRAVHIFWRIPKRKHTDIILYNAETGEILKTKYRKYQL